MINVKRSISQNPIAMAKNAAGAGICVAVAKLSKPLLKDFTKEALIRIKLDF